MNTKMTTLTEDTDVQSGGVKSSVEQLPTEVGGVSVPTPGRAMSFEEAKKWALKKYDNALRELAK